MVNQRVLATLHLFFEELEHEPGSVSRILCRVAFKTDLLQFKLTFEGAELQVDLKLAKRLRLDFDGLELVQADRAIIWYK